MKTVVGGPFVLNADNVVPANTAVPSLSAACDRWAQAFAEQAHQSAMTALRRVMIAPYHAYIRAGEQHMNKADFLYETPVPVIAERGRAQCLDLSAREFHLVLRDVEAPLHAQRWSIDVVAGVMTIRLWNENMSDCRTVTIERAGCAPLVHSRLQGEGRARINGEHDARD